MDTSPTQSMDTSPTQTGGLFVSMDESMSTCERVQKLSIWMVLRFCDGLHREKDFSETLHSGDIDTIVIVCKRDILTDMDLDDDEIIDVDNDLEDPQPCVTMACDIYKNVRASEIKKRPSMETVQKDLKASMPAILFDWHVEVAEEYRLEPETLYLNVNYIDWFLSDRDWGVACMMIASKYEEICAPQVEEFCYLTDNTYTLD